MFGRGDLSLLLAAFAAVAVVHLVNGQSGPVPPRLTIPGAAVVPAQRHPVLRVRRPIPLRTQNSLVSAAIAQRITEEPRPVTESAEEELSDALLAQLRREQQIAQAQQAQFQQSAAAFLNNEPESVEDEESSAGGTSVPTRFPERGQSQAPPSSRPSFNDFGIGSNLVSGQRFAPERPQPTHTPAPAPTVGLSQRTNTIRNRPPVREARPQFETPSPTRPRPKPIQARPSIEQNQLHDEHDQQQSRRQRPVAQTTRKWHQENEDGSITWGYENDDGSFKEEFIGNDCITKGTYGYIDPDGNKREYHYETGIKCDPNNRVNDENFQDNGFVNYEENKAVLPGGVEIDMSQLGKRKSKRPSAIFRN